MAAWQWLPQYCRMDTPATTIYERIGGEAAVRRIVERFYALMDADASLHELRAMHAADLTPMRAKLFEFLSGWFGGPPLYFERPERPCVVSAHGGFAIGELERDQWLRCMDEALAGADVAPELQQLLRQPFRQMAEAMRNR